MFTPLLCLLVSATPVLLSPLSCIDICKTLTDGELNSSKCNCSLELSESARPEKLDDSGIYFEPADIYTLHRLSFVQPPFIIINPGLNIKVERQAPKVILKRKSEKHSSNVSHRRAKHTRRNHIDKGHILNVDTQPLYLDVDVLNSGENAKERTPDAVKNEGNRIDITEKDFKECVDTHLKIHKMNIDDLKDVQLMHNITTKCSQSSNVVKKSIAEIKSKWLRTVDTSFKPKKVDIATTLKSFVTSVAERSHGENVTDDLSNVRESGNIFITENSLITNDQHYNFDNKTEDNLNPTHEAQTDNSKFTTTHSSDSTQHSPTHKIVVSPSEAHEEYKENYGTTYSNTSSQNQQRDYYQKQEQSIISSTSSEVKSQENLLTTENSTRNIDIDKISLPLTHTKSLEYEEALKTEYPYGQINQSDPIENSLANARRSNGQTFEEQTDITTKNSGILDRSENVSENVTVSSTINIEKELENGLRTTDYNYSTQEDQIMTTESTFTIKEKEEDKSNYLSTLSHNDHSNITQEEISVTESSYQTVRDELTQSTITTRKNTQNVIETSTVYEVFEMNRDQSLSSSEMWTNNDGNNDAELNVKETAMQSFLKNNVTNKTQFTRDKTSTTDTVQPTYSRLHDLQDPVRYRDGANIHYATRELTTNTNISTEDNSDITSTIEQSTEKPILKANFIIPGKMDIRSNLDNVFADEFIRNPTYNMNQHFPSTISQFTTDSQDESLKKTKRHGTLIDKNVTIPKVLTREFENDTVLSEVDEDGETFTDDDFKNDDTTSARTTLTTDGTNTMALNNTNAQHFTTFRSGSIDENTLSGKLYFLTGESYIPTRFVQKDNGELTIGIDLVTLCSKLNSNESRLQFIDMMCKILTPLRNN